jgi:hypothetical protein
MCCVHNNYAKFGECQLEYITQNRCRLFKHDEKLNNLDYMHKFNVSIVTLQTLENVSQEVGKELITQSKYALRPGIHRMYFVKPGQL